MTAPVLPPVGPDMRQWGKSLTEYLRRTMDRLRHKRPDDIPAQNGAILWDDAKGYPVVASDGVWRQVVLADGYAQFIRAADVTAAAIDTAYAITFDDPALSGDGVAKDGTNPSRIVFSHGGLFLLSFSAQVVSSVASDVSFRFWPRINGVNVSGSGIMVTTHDNNASTVVSRAVLFSMASGDYLEAMWAVSNISGKLGAIAATAYSPACPAVTLKVLRVHGPA